MPKFLPSFYIVLLLIALYFPLFYCLDALGLYHWDESRNAVSAVEMMQNGNYWVRYFQGSPDTWETKPPLLLWCQIFFYKIIGINTLAVRLPSALTGLALCAQMWWFFRHTMGKAEGNRLGILAALGLVTAQGFVTLHVSRTGDHDALLVFWLTTAVLSFYNWLKTNTLRDILIATGCIVAAVMTKSIIGFILLPGLLLYVITTRQLGKVLSHRGFWMASLVGGSLICGYYIVCERLHPGHWAYVWNMEMLPRYTNRMSNGMSVNVLDDKWYFLKKLWFERMPLVAFLPLALLFGLKFRQTERGNIAWLLTCVLLCFYLTISSGCVNDWYDAPAYPFWAMFLALILNEIFKIFSNDTPEGINEGVSKASGKIWKTPLLFMLFVICCFSMPYFQIMQKITHEKSPYVDENIAPFLNKLSRIYPDIKAYHILQRDGRDYLSPLFFAQHSLAQKGIQVTLHYADHVTTHTLPPQAMVILLHNALETKLLATYSVEKLDEWSGIQVYKIIKPL